jgi:signal transduction histidine kinase
MPATIARPRLAVVRAEAASPIRGFAYDPCAAMLTADDLPAAYRQTMADRRLWWPGIGLTALLALFALAGTGPAATNQHQHAPALSYVLAVGACLPIALARQRPAWTFALTGAATMAYMGLGYPYGPILFALAAAVYALASRWPLRQAVCATAALLAVGMAVIGLGLATGERDWPEFTSMAAWVVIPAAVGVAAKARRDAAADVRSAQARRAISEERLRLAQEVHDVVGHGLAVIAMQAGVALRVLDREPARARASLEAIRSTSTEALDGLRAELEALRRGPGQPGPPRRPHTGLADLPGLVERLRASGLPVTTEVAGGVHTLPADLDRTAYRIVQESLTNVLRHSGPAATAQVRIARNADILELEVLDTGHGAAAPAGGTGGTGGAGGAGQGIDGMRVRAAALGGTLDAGPRAGGGFAVRARLPIAERPQPAPGGQS